MIQRKKISELEDRVAEITEAGQKKNESSFRDHIKCANILIMLTFPI